ncbi:MAG: DUF4377 domain-containing protein [Prevotellaceae bacterium]|jgi:hypothetical protein|nr:DUF4377 domain-containing protein [Prevotellaceae bacterium]
MKTLALTTLFTLFALIGVSAQGAKKSAAPAQQEEQVDFMKVASTYAIDPETGKRCYQIRKGMSRKDANSAAWTTYCGKFSENFRFEMGYEYTLKIAKGAYDPNAEVIEVIKVVGRDNSGAAKNNK